MLLKEENNIVWSCYEGDFGYLYNYMAQVACILLGRLQHPSMAVQFDPKTLYVSYW